MSRERYPNGALIYIGSFKVESGTLHISDPCYEDLKSGADVKVKNGLWHAFVRHSKQDSWFTKGDERVGELLAFHEHGMTQDEDDLYKEPRWKKLKNIGVDSGQMSIFDKKFYRDDSEAAGRKTDKYEEHRNRIPKEEKEEKKKPGELFYGACGCITLPPPLWDCAITTGGTLPHGAVCLAGYGDGSYNVYAAKRLMQSRFRINKGEEFETPEIMAVRVVFIDKDEDEEDEE